MINAIPILTVKHLSMCFGGVMALNNVNFSVASGSITALIGPNGAGKTTLFNCLTGFYSRFQGEIHFHQNEKFVNISKISPHRLNIMGIARTFQNIRLFREMTVIENCLVAQHTKANRNLIAGLLNTKSFREWEKKAIATAYFWLEKFQLSSEANKLSYALPFGKQRHLEIARAMCTAPTLLCLDEPACGLTPRENEELQSMILSLRQENNVTVLLIEHDMGLVMNMSDQVVVLNQGEILCQGNPQTVCENKEVIAAYLGIAQKENNLA